MKRIVVKIGGKLLEDPEHLDSIINQFKQLIFEDKIMRNVVIVPGGGSSANLIRELDDKLKLGEDLAHWMATYTMDYNGLEICKRYPDINCIDDFETLINSLRDRAINVYLPYNYLTKFDDLPHSWDVTSDSIALYIAYHLELSSCFLIKDIDGIFLKGQRNPIKEISANEYLNMKDKDKIARIDQKADLKKSKPIDSYIISLINKYGIPCTILNGKKDSTRILDYFTSNKKNRVYTTITSE